MRKVCWILFIGLLQSTACKEHCPPCSKIPDDAQSLVGEWEWSYSLMAAELPSNAGPPIVYVDTISPESSGSVVLVEISRDGCHRFWIDNEEYCSCVKVINSQNNGDWPNQPYSEQFEVEISGLDLCFDGYFSLKGVPDTLNSLVGRHFPFNDDRQFLHAPELTTGYEVIGYSNYFVRKR